MSSREIARQWFIPGEGIDRTVISADIQRYLGNDATVRPGMGTAENDGVQGYWIKAYRNLTSAMIADLRADSVRWRQEQRQTGTRDPYVGSSTYHASSAARTNSRRDEDSPRANEYGVAGSRDRIPAGRVPDGGMDIDPPIPPRGYPQQERGYQLPPRTTFPSDNNHRSSAFLDARMDTRMDTRGFQPEQPPYIRAPVSTSAYGGNTSYQQLSAGNNDGVPPGYVRQGNYYLPVSSYETSSSMPSRSEPPSNQHGIGSYGQPQGNQRSEPRGYGGGQPEYNDPARFAYPSPAATVSSVSARDREPVTSPTQPSNFGSMGSAAYDQYGRPVAKPQTTGSRQPESYIQPTREPPSIFNGRTPQPPSGGDQRRRRIM